MNLEHCQYITLKKIRLILKEVCEFMESKALALERARIYGVQSFSFGNEHAWSPKL
jgi:hypothetical protein